jgi:hypothetical protein
MFAENAVNYDISRMIYGHHLKKCFNAIKRYHYRRFKVNGVNC